MVRLIINPGDRFGKLTVMLELERLRLPSGQTNRQFLCKCDCGNQHTARLVHLTNDRTKSCGCMVGEKHGMCNTPIYRKWRAILWRCNPNYMDAKYYFDKGIMVCDEWENSFIAFMGWALKNGYKDGLDIDRIDGTKGYYPDNCRFVSKVANANNKPSTINVEYDGATYPIMPLLRILRKDKNHASIRGRIKRGWNHQDAIDTPIRQGNYSKTNFKR